MNAVMLGPGVVRRVAISIMVSTWKLGVACVAAVVVSGCSYSEEGLWPSLSADDPSGESVSDGDSGGQDTPPTYPVETTTEPLAPVALAPVTMEKQSSAPPVTPAPTTMAAQDMSTSQPSSVTGTFVGQEVVSLRSELNGLASQISSQNSEYESLYNDAAQASQRYYAVVSDMNARLQVGTTPGNPTLVGQWQTAQREVDTVSASTSRLSELSNRIAANSDLANYLLESTRAAYRVQGAVEEDHRQLGMIEAELGQAMVSNNRLLNEINETVSRQSGFLAVERGNLTNLALAVSTGRSYGSTLSQVAAPTMAAAPVPGPRGGAPLVVIRFDRPDIEYEQALYDSVSAALARRAEARFELVAVTPLSGGPSDVAANAETAKRNAERVMRSLIDMGLPADRVIMSAETSDSARTNEVQIYQR
jgi:hypothetical protein